MRLLSVAEIKKTTDADRDRVVADGMRFRTETEKARREMLKAKQEALALQAAIAHEHDGFIQTIQAERLALKAEIINLREQTKEPLRRMAEEETRLALLRDEVRNDTVQKTMLMRQLLDEEDRLERRLQERDEAEHVLAAREADIEDRLKRLTVLEAEAAAKSETAGKREQETTLAAQNFALRAESVEKALRDREAALATLTQELGQWRKALEQKEKEVRSRQKAVGNALKELEKKQRKS